MKGGEEGNEEWRGEAMKGGEEGNEGWGGGQ